jgi:hypothetical protein
VGRVGSLLLWYVLMTLYGVRVKLRRKNPVTVGLPSSFLAANNGCSSTWRCVTSWVRQRYKTRHHKQQARVGAPVEAAHPCRRRATAAARMYSTRSPPRLRPSRLLQPPALGMCMTLHGLSSRPPEGVRKGGQAVVRRWLASGRKVSKTQPRSRMRLSSMSPAKGTRNLCGTHPAGNQPLGPPFVAPLPPAAAHVAARYGLPVSSLFCNLCASDPIRSKPFIFF